jgi:hypothetical protein
MGFVDEAHDDRALLNSLLGVFDLEYPALGGAVRVSWSSWEKRELDVQGDGIVIVVVSEHGGQKERSKGFKRKGTGIGGGREGESRRQARWKIERVGERQGGDAANVTDCLLFLSIPLLSLLLFLLFLLLLPLLLPLLPLSFLCTDSLY